MRSFRASGNLIPASLIALFCIAMVVAEGHVEITLSDPTTYLSCLKHKCGLIMLTSFAWVALELIRSFFFPSTTPVRRMEFGMRLSSSRRLLQ
ncbi:hypothetical protein ACFQBQ_12300 [Granulicella cerasi]|uniref:Uncharacterized protein n=1 Tax=Granulicella cerasi TaxID=741063 RepID=A0ABW1ZA86_9BACT|nr:hypothetical protein [Granulicella cerasi]